jgi:hypothetical protein
MGRKLTKTTGMNFHHTLELAGKDYDCVTTVAGQTRQGPRLTLTQTPQARR